MPYVVYPPWQIIWTDATGYNYISPLVPFEDDKWLRFDPDILVDITARNLIEDHHSHPRWVGPFRRHRYPQYSPHQRYVRYAATYNSNRSAAISARVVILAMHLNLNYIHFPQTHLVSSCYEKWCVDINHIAPQKAIPVRQFSIDYADPTSGRPEAPLPAWLENKSQLKVAMQARSYSPEERKAAEERTAKMLRDTLGFDANKKEDEPE